MKYFLPYRWAKKKKRSQLSAISGLLMWMRAPQREHNAWNPADAATPFPTEVAEEVGVGVGEEQEAAIHHTCHPLQWQETGFGPRQLRCIWKEWIQWAQRLAFPTHRTLIPRLDSGFPYYLTKIFDVQTACPLCWKLVYSLTPSPASLEHFSQSYWDTVSWSWSP